MSSLTAIFFLALAAQAAGSGGVAAKSDVALRSGGNEPSQQITGASEIASYRFESTGDDEVYDLSPGWKRRHAPGFPRYVHIRVCDDRPPPGGRSLRVDLNGGAAAAFGPFVKLKPGVDYLLDGYTKTAGLRHDAAWISLTFCDDAHNPLSSIASAQIDGTCDWRRLHIGPIHPPAGASEVAVGVHLEPRASEEDLTGTAWFGSLSLGRVPRMSLVASASDPSALQAGADDGDATAVRARSTRGAAFLVFPIGRPIEVACLVSGIAAPKYRIEMQLLDAGGGVIATKRADGGSAAKASPDAPFRAAWRIPAREPGFYRVRARVVEGPSTAETAAVPPDAARSLAPVEIGLAIVEPAIPSPQSEFGWTLDPADAACGLTSLGDLLADSGNRWVKFPFVCKLSNGATSEAESVARSGTVARPDESRDRLKLGPSPADAMESLINLSDRLSAAGVRLVGMLYPPPPVALAGHPPYEPLAAEALAVDPKTWYPSIEPILGRLATEIRFWQIGSDSDPGWVGHRNLSSAVARVKGALDQIGQNLSVGIAWSLNEPLPAAADSSAAGNSAPTPAAASASRQPEEAQSGQKTEPRAPWRFVTIPCKATASDADLAACLDSSTSAGVARLLSIEALPRTGHSTEDRIAHLTQRMIAAKTHGAEGIFFAHPFDSERGLFDRQGSAGELFVPWRTTALLLGGLPFAGDIDLGGGGVLHCFGRAGKYVGALVAEAPKRASFYLGDSVQSCDVWGRVAACPPGNAIAVDRVPIYLTGLDASITEWQLALGFSPQAVPSIPAAPASVALELKNTFGRAVNGRVRIIGPQHWFVEPQLGEFRLEPGASWKLPLAISLPNDAIAGRQMVSLEFEVQADRLYRFTAHQPIEVTLGDVALEGRVRLNERGELEVRQVLTNRGSHAADFRCELFAPDRRRQATEVLLPPKGQSEFTYRLSEGRRLVGQSIWLRAQELGGPRVLNYRLQAQ